MRRRSTGLGKALDGAADVVPSLGEGGTEMSESLRSEVFLRSAAVIRDQCVRIDSHQSLFPGGRNGPYRDLESPIRNTAHALSVVSIAYALTGDKTFRRCGSSLVRFLLDSTDFVFGEEHVHRQRHPKDWTNGVIGPAWVTEGLTLAYQCLGHAEAREEARRLSRARPFSEDAALWLRRNLDGGPGTVDRTLNHQCFLAGSLYRALNVGSEDSSGDGLGVFFRYLDGNAVHVGNDGILRHHVARQDESGRGLRAQRERALRYVANSPRLMRVLRPSSSMAKHPSLRDAGYHIFSLFALARLALSVPTLGLWQTEELRRALQTAASIDWLETLDDNPFAYPYNGPGLELPLVAEAFRSIAPELDEAADFAFARQIELTYDTSFGAFTRGTDDRLTLMVRVYELGLSLLAAGGHKHVGRGA